MAPRSVPLAYERGRKATLGIGWVTKNLLNRAPPCFGKNVNPLVAAVFAVVSTHQSTLGPRGYGLFPLWVINKKGLCSSSGGIQYADDDTIV
jgi:hypothetical protein